MSAITHDDLETLENCIWGIANIAGESNQARITCLANGMMDTLD